MPHQGWRTQSALLIIHIWRENNWIHIFPKSISAMWNAISLVQDWTHVALSISYDDNHYTTGTSLFLFHIYIALNPPMNIKHRKFLIKIQPTSTYQVRCIDPSFVGSNKFKLFLPPSLSLYIYIYRERERERERSKVNTIAFWF